MTIPVGGGGGATGVNELLKQKREQGTNPDPVVDVQTGDATTGTPSRFTASQMRESLGVGSAAQYNGTFRLNDDFADVNVKNVKVTDHGDVLQEIFNFLGNVSVGLPDYGFLGSGNKGTWANHRQAMGMKGLNRCLEGAMDPGRHLGAAGRCLTMEVTYERTPEKAPPAPPQTALSVQPMTPIRLPDAVPSQWDLDFKGNFASDSATFHGTMPEKFLSNMAALVSQQASGQAKPMQFVGHSFGSVTDGATGIVSTTDRKPSYEAVDGRPGNAAATKDRLEKHRTVGGDVSRTADGQFQMTFTATADVVRSRQDGDHQSGQGLAVVKKFTGMPGTTVGGKPTTINSDDMLTAQRVYAGMLQTQFTAFMIAAQGDPRLPASDRQPFVSAESAGRFNAIQADLKAGKTTMAQAIKDLEAIPEFAKFGGQIPTSFQLERIMPDGSKQPITGQDGNPVAVSRADMDKMLDGNTIRNAPGKDPSTSLSSDPVAGGVDVGDVTASLSGNGRNPNTMQVSGQPQPVAMGAKLPEPPSGSTTEPDDAAVTTVAKHVDDPRDAEAVGTSTAQVDASVQQVQDLLNQGALTGLPSDDQKKIADALQVYLNAKNARAARDFGKALQHIASSSRVTGQQRTQMDDFANALGARVNTSARLHQVIGKMPPDLADVAIKASRAPVTSTPVSGPADGGSVSVKRTTPGGAGLQGAGRTVQAAVEEFQLQALAPRTGRDDAQRLQGARTALVNTLASTTGKAAQEELGAALSRSLGNLNGQSPEDVAQKLLFPNEVTDVVKPRLTVTITDNAFLVTMPVTGGEPVTLAGGTLPRRDEPAEARHGDEPQEDVDQPPADVAASEVLRNPTGLSFDRTIG